MKVTIGMLVLGGLVLVLPVAVGIYVWGDAKSRRMNAPVWALVAALTPSFIGFILYLLVRGNHSNLRCPECDGPVEPDFAACPQCGAKLRRSCPRCSMAVEPDWKVCPRCTTAISTDQVIRPAVRAKDTGLRAILVLVILIPLVVFSLICISIGNSEESGGVSTMYFTVEEYLSLPDSDLVARWIAECPREAGMVYVLEHQEADRIRYLIYMPDLPVARDWELDIQDGLFRQTLHYDFANVNGPTEDAIIAVNYLSALEPNLKVSCGGERRRLHITEVSYELDLWNKPEAKLP